MVEVTVLKTFSTGSGDIRYRFMRNYLLKIYLKKKGIRYGKMSGLIVKDSQGLG